MARKAPRQGYESSKLSAKDESYFKDKAMKHRSVAVSGQPDDTDINNINFILAQYEKAHPGRLRRMHKDFTVSKALKERLPKPIVKGISSDEMTMAFWMPQDLQEVFEKYFPTLWTNKQHLEWFLRHYPVFKSGD